MDRKKAEQIGDRLEKAFAQIEKEFGVKLAKNRCSFDEAIARFTYEFNEVAIGSSGVNEKSPQAIDYLRCAERYGIRADMLGKPVKCKTGTYLFAGVNYTRPKYFVALANDDGSVHGATTIKALPREFFVDEASWLQARRGTI